MASEWREVAIGELAEIYDGPHATPPKTNDGPVFLGISNLASGRIDLTNAERLSEDDYARWTRRVEPLEGDVVFSYETRLGEAAIIPHGLRCCLGRRMGLLRARPGRVDRRLLLYAYLGPQFQETLRSRTIHGSTVDRIPLTEMPSFPIKVPASIDEQRAIAHILGTLDDKIELNRRISETLEAMARALFKSWFVDFDPVRAKAEGRDPGLPKPLADLFPPRLVDSELGEIPERWEVGTIDSLCESIASGGTPARSNPAYWDGRIPWFKTGELLDGPLLDSAEHITDAALANSSCKLWPAGTVLFALYASPTVGRLGVLTEPGTSNQAAAGLVAKVSYGVPFLRRTLLHARTGLQSIAVGAAQQNINQAVLKAHRVVVPAAELAGTYSRLVSPLDDQQASISRQTRTLAALRDALLPKLISGELRVGV